MKSLIKKTKISKPKKKNVATERDDNNKIGDQPYFQMIDDQKCIKENLKLSENALEYFGWAAIKKQEGLNLQKVPNLNILLVQT